MVASLRGGVGSSRRRKDSPQDDEPDSAACGGELAHAWRSLVRKDRSDARGDRHVTFRAHDVVGDWMSRRQADGPERPVVLRGTAGVRARIVLQR